MNLMFYHIILTLKVRRDYVFRLYVETSQIALVQGGFTSNSKLHAETIYMTFIQEDGWDCHKNNFNGFNDVPLYIVKLLLMKL